MTVTIDIKDRLALPVTNMKTTRTYTMRARAAAVEDTRARIQGALFELGTQRLFPDISLDDVARAAGVSVQTVLRHFGSRADLIEAAIDYAIDRIADERPAPVGEVDAAMAVLVDHYEQRGDIAMLMLAQEKSDPQVGRLTERGRRMHRDWVGAVFEPLIGRDEQTIDLLVVATDVYTWKLLRHDRGLSRPKTQERMTALVEAVLATGRP
ncbi:TetR/AcrR family transcriptional regulator [Nocardioides bizhenqiangii]|uniref:TetR/AcrR family transcriptional regulator n=1 Tax=Nocardioides bizhenqiangii TaxID=3095076 RepID=A0ABZ0ZVW2_9ACTN|nr:TetR/AcrR family transcriptional regulator [Nocardioides sp. HM61]WQQ27797.1 TetR/AcrR family transcriptional regulator [Nocardioides sp. HM61]